MSSATPQMARSKWVLIAYSIARGLSGRIRFSLGNIQSTAGLMTAPLSAGAAVDYICRTFADYLQYGGLSAEDLRGRDVLEGGVGDNFGVALLFLAAGARRVVCIDKFFSPHDPAHQREIYLKLRDTLSGEQRTRFDSIVDLSAGKVSCPIKVMTKQRMILINYGSQYLLV